MDKRQSGWVLLALQNAFYRLLHAVSFEEALVETVACGGDTDTNAAICGALLGAVHGRDAVPAHWRRRILTCRPMKEAGARRPRPIDFWPVDACELAASRSLDRIAGLISLFSSVIFETSQNYNGRALFFRPLPGAGQADMIAPRHSRSCTATWLEARTISTWQARGKQKNKKGL
jgi:hypothetical protein